ALFAGAATETVGGVVSGFDTVTVTAAEVVLFPAPSRATAASWCAPLPAAAVFHETEYGAAVSSAPRFAPSRRNWTPTTPTLSEAFADTGTVPDTVALSAGAVTETAGGFVSLNTVTPTVVEVAVFP